MAGHGVFMKRALVSCGLVLGSIVFTAGCIQGGGGGDGGAGAAGGGDGGSAGAGGEGGQGAGGGATTTSTSNGTIDTGSTTGNPPCDAGGASTDDDMDGFSEVQGDCDDCNPLANPNAIEVASLPGQLPADEDCDGQVDEARAVCDTGLALDDASPVNAAKAIDICKLSSGPGDWGLVSAAWVLSDGAAAPATPEYHLGHGILDTFGPNVAVRFGDNLLALSSGTARRPADPGYVDINYAKGYQSGQPAGFPKESPACPGVSSGAPNDSAALEVSLRAPSNATGLAFDFSFYTHEFPAWVCTSFNDLFVAMLAPTPAGQTDGNISFDSMGNTLSVNSAFLEACGCAAGPPCSAGGKTYTCALGTDPLVGNGFGTPQMGGEGGAATGWLTTTAPVAAGDTVTLRFAIHDSADGILDSTVLTDNFRFLGEGAPFVQTVPVQDQ